MRSIAFSRRAAEREVPVADSRANDDPRAHAIRDRYRALFGGPKVPVPVEAIAEDLLGLRISQSDDLGDCSGMLLPYERRILLNATESPAADPELRRQRFTIAHEIGHWVCHCLEGKRPEQPTAMCRHQDLRQDADRMIEREANVFAAELLMPEAAVREAWSRQQDVDALARTFDVSPLALGWRLYSFDLAPRPDVVA